MPSVAAMSSTLRNKARSTSGVGERRSTNTKPTTEPIEINRQASVAGDAQPQSVPLLTARISGARIAATSTVPSQSIDRGRSGSRDSPVVRSVSGMQTAAIGVDPEQRLPAAGLHEQAADERTGGGANGRRGPPQRHGSQTVGTGCRHG